VVLYAPPAIPQFAAGYPYLPSDFNNLVQAPLAFLTTGIFFRAEQHTAQPITATTFTVVAYDTITEDPYSGWNATFSRWLAPYTGWYQITVDDNITSTPDILAGVFITGTTRYDLAQQQPGLGAGGVSASVILPLVGGTDYVQSRVWVNPGATLDTNTPGRYSSMEISYVSQ
jgi:hypothetical protein